MGVIQIKALQASASLFLTLALAAPLFAQDRADRLLGVFESWMADQGVSVGAIAVLHAEGATQKGFGGRDPAAPVPLASLSKAITGACVAVLQQEGALDLDTSVAGLLDMPDAGGVLGDFLSQSAGLWPDRTQGQPWHLSEDRAPRHLDAARIALNGSRQDDQFRYNNENYAVLGAAIDAVAQVDYEADCRQLVLDPLGVTTAALDPNWGPLGAWGGWAMSTQDYARFVKEWFGTNRNIGRDPLSWPHADLGQGRAYVMGAFYRARRSENLFWHAGQLCWNGAGDGSYFASYGGDPVVVVSFKGCVSTEGFAMLDRALFDAALN